MSTGLSLTPRTSNEDKPIKINCTLSNANMCIEIIVKYLNAKSLTNRGQTRHYQSPGVSSETMNTGFSR